MLFELSAIHKIVLYTAAFFNGISFRTFDRLVETFLINSAPLEPVVMDAYINVEKEGAKKVKLIIDEEVLVIWRTHKNKFFSECGLVSADEGGMLIVDFANPEFYHDVKDYIKYENHFFWQQQFEIIENEHLHFSSDIQISERAIDLFIEALQYDPIYYDDDWFIKSIYDIKKFEGESINIDESTPEQQFVKLFWEFIKENNAKLFYDRIGNILEKMIASNMVVRVNKFLNSLFQYANYDVLFILIKKVIYVDNFDGIYWIKQLIERGDTDIKNNAYYLLLRFSGKEQDKVWTAIKTWIPDSKKLENYSPSNRYASFFIVHFYIIELLNFPIGKYGEEHSQYILFENYHDPETREKCKEHIKYILEKSLTEGIEHQFADEDIYDMTVQILDLNWSEHKVLEKIMGIEKNITIDFFIHNYTCSFSTLVADIIETWYHILKGFGEQYHSDAKAINGFILKTIADKTQDWPTQVNNIIKHWQKKPGIYDQVRKRLQEYRADNEDDLSEKYLKVIDDLSDSIVKRMQNFTHFFDELNEHL